MKRTYILILFLSVLFIKSYALDLNKIAEELEHEGKTLYKHEMASWHGTDLFLEHYSKTENIGGYFSYIHEDSIKNVFFSREENPLTLGIITFDSTFAINKATIEMKSRDFSEQEKLLYDLRLKALKEIHTDTIFKYYDNTSLNIIPLIYKGEKKVYILTGPKVNGVIIFGNDYLLTFDENNNLKTKQVLHKNIIPIGYGGNKEEESVLTMHSHLPETGDFITPTDICTLMLYSGRAGWEEHYVTSENYTSIWDCRKNTLTIVNKPLSKYLEEKPKNE